MVGWGHQKLYLGCYTTSFKVLSGCVVHDLAIRGLCCQRSVLLNTEEKPPLTEQGRKILQVVPNTLIRRFFPAFLVHEKHTWPYYSHCQKAFVTLRALYTDTEDGLCIHPLTVGF